ncbi:tol-pal system protein YbgF [Chitinivorax tropicus]|uniref:Cell division coordinator CpoB n=1 Tax=Chitinivorax tropicus TaxID=714531 RepID=A0A840MF51_9PROT|nr:tol-pal system protein YbgF [Chitinivorax tropicus]MBB5017308.1 tol-pal system protein YbgF [Chitinivorax tropicus]
MKRLLPLAILALSASSQAGLFDDTEARKMITDLRTQIEQLRQDNHALRERLNQLETRVDNLKVSNLVSQLDAQVDNLNKLNGQLEVLQYNIEQTQKRQKDFYVDLDSRLRALEPGGGDVSGSTSSDKPLAAVAKAEGDQAAYDAAFNLYKMGNYQGAVSGFRDYLKAYADSKLAPNAQYWIGMSQSALRDYKGAIATQQKLIVTWPDANKVPDAMFNIAANHIELGDKKAAKKMLDDLVAKYPVSTAADKAKRLLANSR